MNLTMIQHARQVPTLENQQYNEGNCLFFFTSLSKPMFVQISHGYSSLLTIEHTAGLAWKQSADRRKHYNYMSYNADLGKD